MLLGVIDAPPAQAQAPQSAPERAQPATSKEPAEKPLHFEAASIRVATGSTPRGGLCELVGPDSLVSASESKIASRGGNLVSLIDEAYESSVDGFDFPDWVKGGDRFAVSVTIPPNTTVAACHAMIANLLAERFHLVTAFETREVARLYIKVAKSGFRLKPADESKADPNAPISSTPVPGTIHYTYRATPISRIITGIESLAIIDSRTTGLINDPAFRMAAGGGVVDETGLTGAYDGSFDVYTTPPADGSPAESFQDSLTRQLGLTLELRRAPGKVLVIRSGDRAPTEN